MRSKEITWAQIAKALTEVQTRKRKLEPPEEQQAFQEPGEPDIIDADFREIKDEPQEPEAATQPEPEAELVEQEEESAEQDAEEESDPEPELDPEEYGRFDVEAILRKEKGYLKGGREADCPAKFIKEHKILVDALILLLNQIDEGGAEL